MKDLTNVIKKLGTKMVGKVPTESNSLTEIIDAIADQYTGGGGSGGTSDYNQLENAPIINVADGQQFVNGAYYKTADKETINLTVDDDILKIVFDVTSAPTFESIVDETWVDIGEGMLAKNLIKLTYNDKHICVIGTFAEIDDGEDTWTANQIFIMDADFFAGEEPTTQLAIYGNENGDWSWFVEGGSETFMFDPTTGEFTFGEDAYTVSAVEAYANTFAYEQLGGLGDICRYINGELKKLITNDDVDLSSIEARLTAIEQQLQGLEARLQNI